MLAENWRPVHEWETLYSVSDHGRVKRIAPGKGTRSGRILKPQRITPGYTVIWLCDRGHRESRLVHIMVLRAFLGPKPRGKEANHKNGDRADARLKNLEYLTRSENILHSYRELGHRLVVGEARPNSVLTEKLVKEARRLFATGKTIREISDHFAVHYSTIHTVVKGGGWKHLRP